MVGVCGWGIYRVGQGRMNVQIDGKRSERIKNKNKRDEKSKRRRGGISEGVFKRNEVRTDG